MKPRLSAALVRSPRVAIVVPALDRLVVRITRRRLSIACEQRLTTREVTATGLLRAFTYDATRPVSGDPACAMPMVADHDVGEIVWHGASPPLREPVAKAKW